MSTTSQTLTEGDTIALTAGATGAAGIQWYYKKGDEAPKPVDGATTASLSVAATMEYNGADIYCQFVNDAGAVTTSFCRITVNAKPAAPVTTKNPTGETVTEGEILDALHEEIPATTIDGVKRRCGAGMGRCQGGFCGPRVLELISKTLGISPLDVLQDKAGTNVLLCETKQEGTNHD